MKQAPQSRFFSLPPPLLLLLLFASCSRLGAVLHLVGRTRSSSAGREQYGTAGEEPGHIAVLPCLPAAPPGPPSCRPPSIPHPTTPYHTPHPLSHLPHPISRIPPPSSHVPHPTSHMPVGQVSMPRKGQAHTGGKEMGASPASATKHHERLHARSQKIEFGPVLASGGGNESESVWSGRPLKASSAWGFVPCKSISGT